MDFENFWILLDLVRVTLVGVAIFLILPYLAVRDSARRRPWHDEMAAAFAGVSFYLLFGIAALGHGRAARPGSAALLYALWIAGTALAARKRHSLFDALPDSRGFERLFGRIEQTGRGWWKTLPIRTARQPLLLFFVVLAISALAYGSFSVLATFRFARAGDYDAALSLHALATGAAWDGNPRVVLLAPLIWFGGVDAATAVRLSDPLLLVLLSFSAFACALRYSPDLSAGQLAAGLGLLAWVLVEPSLTRQTGGVELTAIFALLAAARWRRSWGDCALALLSMAYAGTHWPVLPCVAAGAGLAALGIACVPARWRTRPSLAWAPIAMLVVYSAQGRTAPPETLPYESAARVTARIAREHADRDWLLVSSGREAAQVAGRGWHLPLSDLVTWAERSGSASRPGKLPYQARDVFVLVELRPFRTGLTSLALGSGDADHQEFSQAGRASLHFRATRIMERYLAVHREAAVYHQDADIVVYRVPGATQAGPPDKDGPARPRQEAE